MGEGFGEWIISNAKGRTDCVCKNCGRLNVVEFKGEGHISVRVLGEWAWQKYLIYQKEYCRLHNFAPTGFEDLSREDWHNFFEDEFNVDEELPVGISWLEIAVSCLGRDEVEKRLERGGGKK